MLTLIAALRVGEARAGDEIVGVDGDHQGGRVSADRGQEPAGCRDTECGSQRIVLLLRAGALVPDDERVVVGGERVVEGDGRGQLRIENRLQLCRHLRQQGSPQGYPGRARDTEHERALPLGHTLARFGAVLVERESPRLRVDAQQLRAGWRRGIRPLAPRLGDDDVCGLPACGRRDARRGLLERSGDREDAVGTDHPVDHRGPHRWERRVERLTGRGRHGAAYSRGRPLQPRRRPRFEPGERLQQFGDIAASEVRGHPLVAHGVLRPAYGLAGRVDQERLDEPADLGDGGDLPGELAFGGPLEDAVRRRFAQRTRGLRTQVVELLCEEVHTLNSAEGPRHSRL